MVFAPPGRVRLDYECTADHGVLPAYAKGPAHPPRGSKAQSRLAVQMRALRRLRGERPAADGPMADLRQRSAYGPPADLDDESDPSEPGAEDEDALTAPYVAGLSLLPSDPPMMSPPPTALVCNLCSFSDAEEWDRHMALHPDTLDERAKERVYEKVQQTAQSYPGSLLQAKANALDRVSGVAERGKPLGQGRRQRPRVPHG